LPIWGCPTENGIDSTLQNWPARSRRVDALLAIFRALPIWQRMRWPLGRTGFS